MDTKHCPRCDRVRCVSEFHRDKRRPDGRYAYCAECKNASGRELAARRRVERESKRQALPTGMKKCPCCKVAKTLTEFYTSPRSPDGRNCHCKDCIKRRSRERYRNDPDYRAKLVERRRKAYASDPDNDNAKKAAWIAQNPARYRAMLKRRHQKRMSTIQGRLEHRVIGAIRQAVRRRVGTSGKPTDWFRVLGYSLEELRQHLEAHFSDGMSWEAFRSGQIQIDHIVPRAAFHYETVEDADFRECWALSNLRPLWRHDNRAKSDLMADGTDGREIGRRKRQLLDEDRWVAGYETQRTPSEEEILA